MGSCSFFFSSEGLPGQLTIYLGDAHSARALNDPPDNFPGFSDATIRITSGGKTESYSLKGNGPFNVPVPSEKYTVDVNAQVSHPANGTGDKFPFAKSFGGSAEGPFPDNTAVIALSLGETEIIVPVKGDTDTQFKFVSLINTPSLTAGKPLSLQSTDTTPAFDLDHYGRLFTWDYQDSYRIVRIGGNEKQSFELLNSIPSLPGISYDKKHERVYFVSEGSLEKIKISYLDLSGDAEITGSLTMKFGVSFNNAMAQLFSGEISERKVITLDTRNNNTYIYIGAGVGSESADSIVLKYEVKDKEVVSIDHVTITGSRIKDLRVIDNYVYAITESINTSGATIIAIDADKEKVAGFEKPSRSLPIITANNPYYFQRIVGWDTGSIYVLECWGTPVAYRISKISRDLKRIEDTGLNVPDAVYWK
jgi:hypothetical protein